MASLTGFCEPRRACSRSKYPMPGLPPRPGTTARPLSSDHPRTASRARSGAGWRWARRTRMDCCALGGPGGPGGPKPAGTGEGLEWVFSKSIFPRNPLDLGRFASKTSMLDEWITAEALEDRDGPVCDAPWLTGSTPRLRSGAGSARLARPRPRGPVPPGAGSAGPGPAEPARSAPSPTMFSPLACWGVEWNSSRRR